MGKSHKRHLRILVVDTLDYQHFNIGGALTFIKRYLKHSQFEFYLVGITDNDGTEVGVWNHITVSSKRFHFLPVAYIDNPRKSYRLSLVLNCLRYKKRILQFNYDAIFVQSSEFAFPFILSRIPIFFRMAGATNPLVISKFNLFRSSFFQSLFALLFFLPVVKKARRVFAINQECEHLLTSFHVSRHKIRRIYLGIDLAPFQLKKHDCRQNLGLHCHAKILIYTGRLYEAKGIDLIIDALSLMRDEDITLIIVGDGEEKQKIQQQIERKRLGNVLLVGSVTPEEIPKYLKAADIFCMASHYEGLSNSMIEAVGAGLPIVTTNVAGAVDIVTDGKNGRILYDRNLHNYALAIREVLGFNMKEVQEFSNKLCNEKFNMRNIAKFIDQEIMNGIYKSEVLT